MSTELDVQLKKDDLLNMYQKMLLCRFFDEKACEYFTKGEIPGGIHSGVGQEAVAVGAIAAIKKEDYMFCSHRGHAHTIMKGADPKRMMAELYAKETGYCRGKGGSIHIADISTGNLGAISVVAAQIPLAAGVGLSIKLRKTDQVCLCFFGDGAANQGAFHEGINFAALWKLPVIFICENNQYAVSVSVEKSTSVKDIAIRAAAYGIPGVVLDGMDTIAVYNATRDAVKSARKGEGPTLIECKTYRYYGHSRGDPKYGPYRTKEEWNIWKAKDPLVMFEKLLVERGILTAGVAEELRQVAEANIDESIEYARRSPKPGPESVLEDIFV